MTLLTLSEYKTYADHALALLMASRLRSSHLSIERRLLGRYADLLLAGGKRLRGYLGYLGYVLAGGKESSKALPATLALECLHATILLFDDIIDQDSLRRGKPTVHVAFAKEVSHAVSKKRAWYGESQALVSGIVSTTLPYQILLDGGWEEETLGEGLRNIVITFHEVGAGEALDTELSITPWRRVSVASVMHLYEYKTARYSIARPLEFGAALAKASLRVRARLIKLAIPAGIAFQITDDVLGIYGDAKSLGKPIGSDLREGKRTLLTVLMARHTSPLLRDEFGSFLGSPVRSKEVARVRELLEVSGVRRRAENLAGRLVAKSSLALTRMEGMPREPRERLDALFHSFLTRHN